MTASPQVETHIKSRSACALMRDRRSTIALLIATILIVLGARLFGPSDLYQNLDQSKTAAFTADIVLNGRWVMPRDSTGALTRKPPLVNWIAAPVVSLGIWEEWALKLPSILAGLATVGVTILIARRAFVSLDRKGASAIDQRLAQHAGPLGIACGAVWLASPSAVKHIYFCRPDMLLIALMTAGWASAWIAHQPYPARPETTPPQHRALLTMWICTGLAILAKGPMALLVPIFLVLVTLVRSGSLRPIASIKWWWGGLITLAIPAAWLLPALDAQPEHVRRVLLGEELIQRIGGGLHTWWGVRLESLWRIPPWFIERFAPWSVLAVVSMVLVPIGAWRRHPLMPAGLWIALVLIATISAGGLGGSYIAPAYPAAAVLAVYAIATLVCRWLPRWSRCGRDIAVGAVAMALLVAGRESFFSRGARSGLGRAVTSFARQIRADMGDDRAVFLSLGHNPISTLAGRFQAGEPDESAVQASEWVVMRLVQGPTPVRVSEPLRRRGRDSPHDDRYDDQPLALYHRSDLPATDWLVLGVQHRKPGSR